MFPTKLFLVTYSDGSSERIPDKIPVEKHHRADVIVEVNVATGSSFVIKNRWGPSSRRSDGADRVHFESWKDMESQGVEIWPGKAGFAQLTMNGVVSTYRHSVTTPPYKEHPEMLVRRTMVVTGDGRKISMPRAGGRQLELLRDREPGHSIFHMTRVGQGIDSVYQAWAQQPELAPIKIVAGAGLRFPEVLLKEAEVLAEKAGLLKGPEINKAVVGCNCDIKDLMSTGHRAGCPEKR